MAPYITVYSDHPLSRWLATLAVSLVLLALAYAHAPDPAEYLGFAAPSAPPLATRRPVSAPHRYRLAAGQASALAATQVGQPNGRASRTQFAR